MSIVGLVVSREAGSLSAWVRSFLVTVFVQSRAFCNIEKKTTLAAQRPSRQRRQYLYPTAREAEKGLTYFKRFLPQRICTFLRR